MAGTSALSSGRWSRPAAPDDTRGGADADAELTGSAPYRAQLEARWRATLERVTALSVAYHEPTAAGRPGPSAGQAADPRLPDRASQEQSRLAREVVAERQALAEIEAALDRIAAGRYGRCERCRRLISAGLLGAQPEARFCPACSRRAGRLLTPA
ncbi:MAG TPA: hypothetical protein VEJ42_04430 [Streptosporangiaceae bacterium]|nr:hypothetical protein [Streptosporangiaceae bacterium]